MLKNKVNEKRKNLLDELIEKQKALLEQGKLYLIVKDWDSDEGVITHIQPEKIIVYKWFRNRKVEYKIQTICTRFEINWEYQTFTLLNHHQKDGQIFEFETNRPVPFGVTGFVHKRMWECTIQILKQLEAQREVSNELQI